MRKSCLFFILVSFFLPLCVVAAEDEPEPQAEIANVFIVSEYRFESGAAGGGDPDIGQSLCGTRCNALSVDYLNYVTPGGWRMIKVADKRELIIELGNPFLNGKCICVADEYQIKVNDLYMSK